MSLHASERWTRLARSILSVVLVVVAGSSVTTPARARVGVPLDLGPVRHACADPPPGRMACLALVRTDVTPRHGVQAHGSPAGLGAADLRSAYALPSTSAGQGQTVAVVDAYDDPNAEADLAVYRRQYGLPPCTTANGCFRKVDQNGGTALPAPDTGWAEEISLDLDMVSAACPNCRILLVEASEPTMRSLGTAVDTAVGLGARYVSNSYGGTEDASDTGPDGAHFDHPGVAITASSGDGGYGVLFPATAPYVTAVGGTSLRRTPGGRGWTETAWSGAGSGCSAHQAKPAWQRDLGCARRTIADVSAVADPKTGVAVYDSYGVGGWLVVGGTSAAAPIVAGAYALAGPPAPGSRPAAFPYARPWALNDVTSGGNGSCSPGYLCTAGPGYDGPTGLGTPNGIAAFRGTAAPAHPAPAGGLPTGPNPAGGIAGSPRPSPGAPERGPGIMLTVTGEVTGL